MHQTALQPNRTRQQKRVVVCTLMLLIVSCALCPIQYWALGSYVDNTWYFALNYAAAHHMILGQDIVWTQGPLAYLGMPQDIGSNLARGLAFQFTLWLIVIAILWDVFFRSDFPLRNLAFFAACLALSAVLYPIPGGAADLLMTGALILLAQFHLRGGMVRFVAALTMLGFIPLIQIVGAMTVIGLIAGIVLVQVVGEGRRAWTKVALAVLLPAIVTGAGYAATIGWNHALVLYLKAAKELSSGYSSAMSATGPLVVVLAALEATFILAIALVVLGKKDRRLAVFMAVLWSVPLLVSFKHGFVRQDTHVVHYFGFIAILIGLVFLILPLEEMRTTSTCTILLVAFLALYQDHVGRWGLQPVLLGVTGIRAPSLVWHASRFQHLQLRLKQEAQQEIEPGSRIEPEIKAIVQHEPVASLSVTYSPAYLDGLNLALYPVIQRYSAYTPYLDQLNAGWIRERGPRFLIFDGQSIDGRHPWTETPATWVEVYRWYDSRWLGSHNLLLERRAAPRFTKFESLGQTQMRFGDAIRFPASRDPVFWSMQCPMTRSGGVLALLFRVPEVTMSVEHQDQSEATFRVLPAVMASPSMGSHLPDTLSEFKEVFATNPSPGFTIDKLTLGGPGSAAYGPVCSVGFLRPVR